MFTHLRPIIAGILLFLVLNTVATVTVTFVPKVNQKLNASMVNHLPAKLAQLDDRAAEHHPEVLFLGTSQTDNGFSPKDFNDVSPVALKSFNLGLPGTRYDVMLANLESYRRRYGNPKLVLLEVSPSNMERNSVQFYLPSLHYRSLIENNPQILPFVWQSPVLSDNVRKELAFGLGSAFYQFRPIFSPLNIQQRVAMKVNTVASRFLPEASAQEVNPSESFETSSDTVILEPNLMDAGWHPKKISPTMTTPEGVKVNAIEARKFYLDQMTEVDFGKISHVLSYCRQHQIPVVLVSWPNHPAFLKHFQATPFDTQYQQGLKSLLAKYQAPYIDLSFPSSESLNGMFADTRHLSPEGARRISKRLALRVFQIPEARQALTGNNPSELAQESSADF